MCNSQLQAGIKEQPVVWCRAGDTFNDTSVIGLRRLLHQTDDAMHYSNTKHHRGTNISESPPVNILSPAGVLC